jgi:hypothetical protein
MVFEFNPTTYILEQLDVMNNEIDLNSPQIYSFLSQYLV